jgi:uncharacterized damage-inducible protein DinB
MARIYRKGGLGAMQDEYEHAAADFFKLLESIDGAAYIAEHPEESESLRSIEKIMSHVVRSAFGYINKIRKTIGIEVTIQAPKETLGKANAIAALHKALEYTASSFEDKWSMPDEELDTIKMSTPWGVEYSIEQMMEHAIVHILRHRRQIERILNNKKN